jgi:HNH endonuclease
MLVDEQQDRDAAHRWNVANRIRRKKAAVIDKLREFFRENVGKQITGEELRYLARNKTEWARRVRQLRTEQGWPIVTQNSGDPNLPVGVYVLEADRQSPEHDRTMPDATRRKVLRRDDYRCRDCEWSHAEWNPSDPRHLELHHLKPHVEKGKNTEDNLITICTVCHDEKHRKLRKGERT